MERMGPRDRVLRVKPAFTQVLHGCRQLVSRDVGLSPATSATLVFSCHRVKPGTLKKLPVISRRKAGMTSSPHGPYGLGYTRATMAVTEGRRRAIPRPPGNTLCDRLSLLKHRA